MKTLDDMTLEELWQLFPIILREPDPRWRVWAAEEIRSLRPTLGSKASSISHIGSTAVDGIWAKPIVDLLVEAAEETAFRGIEEAIIEAGYTCMHRGEGRADFNKGYTPVGFADRVFHLHLRLPGDNDEIFFRDYLNARPEVAREYEKLKLSLWKEFEHDRDAYTAAKTDFVKRYTALARQSVGKLEDGVDSVGNDEVVGRDVKRRGR